MTQTNSTRDWRVLLAPSRDDVVDGLFLFILGVLGLVGFRTTYAGINYLVVGVAGLLLGIVIAYLANALRQPILIVVVMAVAVFFLLGGALALRAQAGAGILPTIGTTRGLASVSIHGWKQLLTTLPPVDSSGPLLVIPYILGLVGGVGGFAMARRLRSAALPLLAPVAVLAAVILLGTAQPAAELLQGAVFAIVALGWVAVRGLRLRPPVQNGVGQRSRIVTAAAIIGVTAIGAAAIGPQLPGGGEKRVVLRSYVTPPFDINAYPSPLVGFRKYTKPSNNLWDQTLFTVKGLHAGEYVRIATLDDYNGSVWGATSGTVATGPDQPLDSFQRVGSTIATRATGKSIALRVTIAAAYASSSEVNAWLPLVGSATSVDFLGPNRVNEARQFVYNRATDQGIVPGRLQQGDTYVVHAVTDTADLARPAPIPNTALPYGSPTLASNAYAFTSAQATKWSAGVVGAVPQVLAVAKHLAENGAFSDGGGDEAQYLPGHSLFRLSTDFLDDKQPVGDDEQFAAAFALLANQLGVPARVVLGAEPEAHGVVQGKDIHTWVEVHLSDGAWATIPRSLFMPPTTKKPEKKLPQTIQNANASVVPPPNPLRPRSALNQASQGNATSTHANASSGGGGWQIPGFVLAIIKWAGPPLLLVLAICALIVGLKARRRHRRRTLGTATIRVSRGWNELVDQARDLGVSVPAGGTRREEAQMLDGYNLSGLAGSADATVFGPGEPPLATADEYWRDVDAARRAMTQGMSRWRRWRAAVSLRSLFPRADLRTARVA